MSELPQVHAPRCVNLQSKAMVVHGEAFEDDPEYQADLTDYWCLLTAKPLGPDNDSVSMADCCDSQRQCYCEF